MPLVGETHQCVKHQNLIGIQQVMRSQRRKLRRVMRKLRRVMRKLQLQKEEEESALQDFFSVDYRRCAPVCLYACVTHIHFHIHTKEAYLLHCYWCTHIKQQLQQHQRRQHRKKEEDVQRSQRKVDFFESGGMGVAAYIHTGMYRPTYIHTYIHTYKHTHTYTRRHICLLSNWATPLPTPHPNMHYWN